MANDLTEAAGVPPSEAIQADLAASEALLAAGRLQEAEQRLQLCEDRLDPRGTPGTWESSCGFAG